MIRTAFLSALMTLILMVMASSAKGNPKPPASTAPKDSKAKFYDFDDMLIDGQIRKPQALYIDHRQKVRFERLLKLKKSFLPNLMKTAKEPVFR